MLYANKLNVATTSAREHLVMLGVDEEVGNLIPAVEHELTQSKNLMVS